MTNVELMGYWIESSDDDYDVMKDLYNSKRYNWCLFLRTFNIRKINKGYIC